MTLECKRPEDVPEGWIGIARIRALFRPVVLRALVKRDRFVHFEDQMIEVHPHQIDACFDFPVAEAMAAQAVRPMPPLETGQHWRSPEGDSLTIGPTTRGKEIGSSFACFLLLRHGDFTSGCHGREALLDLIHENRFKLVAGPGSEKR